MAMADAASGDTAASPSPAGKNERKILYYRNPMGLPDTSPEPKKDSMGMDYIAVYEDDEPDDSGVVKVSPARVQTLGVKTARAEERTLDSALAHGRPGGGRRAPDSRRCATLRRLDRTAAGERHR
jgi:Cu(I)/Ag(I) efflux system membrane fusion protein